MNDVHYADILILLGVMIFLIRGYMAGLILSVLGIVVFFVSMFFGILYNEECSELFKNILPFIEDSTARALAFLVIFFGLVTLLGFFVKLTKILNKIPIIGNLNQSLGAFIGLLKGIFVVSLILFFISLQPPKSGIKTFVKSGVLYDYFIGIAPSIYDGVMAIIPIGQSFYDEFNEDVRKEVDEQIEKNI